MENTAIDSVANESLISKNNILAIGDKFPRKQQENQKKERTKNDFNAEFTKRLSQLLMGDPNVVPEEKFFMEDLLLNINKVDDMTKHYVFSINKTANACISYSCTIDAKNALRGTKKKLSNEKWISANVMERTCLRKGVKDFMVDNTVYQAMGDSLNEQVRQIVNYICFLQQEFLKQRKL